MIPLPHQREHRDLLELPVLVLVMTSEVRLVVDMIYIFR